MTTPGSHDELREWLEQRLKKEVPDPVWDELDRDHYVASALESDQGMKLLIKKTRTLMSRYRRRADEHFTGKLQKIISEVIPEHEYLRSGVMSDHWARHAREDSDVRWFRASYLGGDTVSREQAKRFLEANARDEEVMRDVETACKRLSRLFQWNTRQALIFLFTGRAPTVEAIQVDRLTRRKSKWGNSARVTLSFDLWVSNSTIFRAVSRLRRMATQLAKRPIERKTLELADFVSATMFDKRRLSQRDLMDEWNLDFPEWRYSDERHFARDCKRAKRIILFMNAAPPDLGPGEEMPGAF